MQEKNCDFWLEPAAYRCIPTNGSLGSGGLASLDLPIAREAASRYQNLEADLGHLIASRGSHVFEIRPGLLSFPIKQFRWSMTVPAIVVRSANELVELVGDAVTLLPSPPGYESDEKWEPLKSQLTFLPQNVIIVRPASYKS